MLSLIPESWVKWFARFSILGLNVSNEIHRLHRRACKIGHVVSS